MRAAVCARASFSASADDVTWASPTPVDPPIAYTVFPTRGDRHAVPRSAHVRQIGPRLRGEIERGHALEDLSRRTCRRPPPAGRRRLPRRSRCVASGSSGRVVQVSAAGSYASTVARSEVPFVPPTAYTSLPSDAAPNICRGVGMGAPSFQEVPSKISVVFSSLPLASTPPVTIMRSPTTAAAAAARGCNRGGSSVQRLLTTRQTRSVATFDWCLRCASRRAPPGCPATSPPSHAVPERVGPRRPSSCRWRGRSPRVVR